MLELRICSLLKNFYQQDIISNSTSCSSCLLFVSKKIHVHQLLILCIFLSLIAVITDTLY